MTLRRLLMLVALLIAASPAWAKSDCTEAEKILKAAFTTYCDTERPRPDICTNQLSLALQYLALEEKCSENGAAGKGYCADFRAAQANMGCTEAEKTLKLAFINYCGSTAPDQPEICTSQPSLARKYLALEAVCPAGSTEAYCIDFEKIPQLKGYEVVIPLVLALDHQTGRWSTRNRLAGATEPRIKLDVAGEPTVSLAKQEQITVVVEKTNPLLYGAVAGKPTEENVPELANIQKLLSLLGGNIASFLSTVATEKDRVEAMSLNDLTQYLVELETQATTLQNTLELVKCRAGQTAVQTSRAVVFIQGLELGNDAEYLFEPPLPSNATQECSNVRRPRADHIAEAFSQLQENIFILQSEVEGCAARLDATRAVITVDSVDSASVRAAILQREKVMPCGSETLETYLNSIIEDIEDPLKDAELAVVQMRVDAARLKELEALSTPSADEIKERDKLRDDKKKALQKQNEHLAKMRLALADERARDHNLLNVSNLLKRMAALRAEAEVILATRDTVQKAAAQIEVFERRLDRYRMYKLDNCPGGPCVKKSSLDLRLILEPQLKSVNSTKIQKHSVTIKLDSPYAAQVIATRAAELKADYQLDSVLRGLWGISASVIYTDLASPTFSAVADENDPMKKVIAITDETTRAGDIALLADFRLGQWLACRKSYDGCSSKSRFFGVEFGAGVSDDPAFYAGISLRPSRSWRLGFGYTYQQVKELRGQQLGQVVASTEDIRRRDTFEGDWYISLSFALDSLSLFSAGD